MTPLIMPRTKLTLGAEVFENAVLSGRVTRVENGFDSATLNVPNTELYPTYVTAKTPIQLDVKDASDSSWVTIFKGITRFPIINIGKQKMLTLSCLGAGYGLGQMLVAQEYGSQSTNPTLHNITDIITDIDPVLKAGIVTYYVNNVLGIGGSSGFSYATAVANIADTINYIQFPYKPAMHCINDLIDIVTALKDGSAGPHWIVTTDDTIRCKLINASLGTWTKYYGDSQENATLTYGVDYSEANFEPMGAEANYVLYYGVWRRPSNGDNWTNPSTTGWSGGANITLSIDTGHFIVGTASLKATLTDVAGAFFYPSTQDAAWDFSMFGAFHVPTFNFYASKHQGLSLFRVYLLTDASNYFYFDIEAKLLNNDEFYHFSLPIGPYYDKSNEKSEINWVKFGSPDWTDINYIQFSLIGASTNYVHIDGLYFGNAPVCRVAYNSGISPYCMKLITDDVGKDDSLIAGDDSGLMAQLAKAELMRQQKAVIAGTIQVTTMLPDALPGQWFYVQAKDYRATKLMHNIAPKPEGLYTLLFLTDDLTNGRARLRYEDLNKQWESIRPEFQDRQASSIKAGQVDIRIPVLAVDYV